VTEWKVQREQIEDVADLSSAIEQLNAGLGQLLDEALEDIRQRINIANE